MPKFLIVDDHPMFRDALSQVVRLAADDADCVEAETLAQALKLIDGDDGFDLVLLDLGLPGNSGLSAVLELRTQSPTTPVAIVSASDDFALVHRTVQLGVNGFLPKSLSKDAMAAAVTAILDGATYFPTLAPPSDDAPLAVQSLTARQRTVLRLLGEGKANKQIAHELNISQETAKIHISAILRKLGVSSRTQAVLLAHRIHLGDDSSIGSRPEGHTR